MRYTEQDLHDALANRDTSDKIPYKSLRLGAPWGAIYGPASSVWGLEVIVVESLEDDQPYLVAPPAYGNREKPLDMQHALRRKVMELLRSCRVVVQAPYHNCAGSRDLTHLFLSPKDSTGEPVEDAELTRQLCRLIEDRVNEDRRVDVGEGVELSVQSSNVILAAGRECKLRLYDTWISEWAKEHLGAEVSTLRLRREVDKLKKQLDKLQPFVDKYLTKPKIDQPVDSSLSVFGIYEHADEHKGYEFSRWIRFVAAHTLYEVLPQIPVGSLYSCRLVPEHELNEIYTGCSELTDSIDQVWLKTGGRPS